MKFIIFFIVFVKLCSSSVLKEGRIVHGRPAAHGEFPYQVGLSLVRDVPLWCGGSLINNQWILTAAHCTSGVTKGKAYLGSTSRARAKYTYSFSANDIFTHSAYKRKGVQNDIALIKLPAAINYTSDVRPIKLALDNARSYENLIAFASGWGRTGDHTNASESLNYAALPIISLSKCSPYYRSTITKYHICVSTTNGSSTCQGDSGGPLTIKLTNGDLVQIGIASFISGRGCASGHPAAFTRISSYIPWIQGYTKNFQTAL